MWLQKISWILWSLESTMEYVNSSCITMKSDALHVLGRDEAVKQADSSTARASQAEATVSRLQAQEGKQADMSAQLSVLLQQNKELTAQLHAVTEQASRASPDPHSPPS
jgi:hypothetical protein